MAAGSGNAQFGDASVACVNRPELPIPRLTMSDVQALVQSAQELVGSRPSGGYTVEWCVKAAQLGDLGALNAAAIRAARSTATLL